MKKKLSTAEKVRRMIDQGHTNKAIIDKLGVKPQAVYNIRYQVNKARGLGAIGAPTPAPSEGIGAPPKRVPRKVRAGTGITPTLDAPKKSALKPEQQRALVEETLRHHPEFLDKPPFAITMIEPPSLWQRIVRFFKGN